jgi:hypothetical protein
MTSRTFGGVRSGQTDMVSSPFNSNRTDRDASVSVNTNTRMESSAFSTTSQSTLGKTPEDRGNLAYNIMFWQGVGQLFPWNAFITASSYFSQRFCETDVAKDFENYFSISFTSFQTIGLGISVLYGSRLSLHDKIVYPLILYAILFGLTTGMVIVEDIDGYLLFWITFLSSCMNGLAGAILSAGLFSLGGCLPQTYTSALMTGQGLAGLSVAVAGIFTQAVGPAPEGWCKDSSDSSADDGASCLQYTISYSALSYFLIATVVLASCAILFYVLVKLPFTEYHIRLAGIHIMQVVPSNENIREPLLASPASNPVGDTIPVHGAGRFEDNKIKYAEVGFSRLSVDEDDSGSDTDEESYSRGGHVRSKDNTVNSVETAISAPSKIAISFKDSKLMGGDIKEQNSQNNEGGINLSNVLRVLKVIRIPAFSVWFVFTVTIALFPSITVFLISHQHCQSNDRFFNDLFVPFFFVLFNLGDFMGRVFAGSFGLLFTAENVWIPALCRLVYFPLFLLCNISNSQLPVVFSHDAWPIFFMITFAVSNGYVANNCMMIGPTLVKNEDKPLAATIMIFCLTAGLLGGACVSFGATALSQGSHSFD